MATPANRVPVRIARGSKASLDTAITAGDLKEGEICYATDENGIYVVEGGVLTQAGADLASTSIDALSDVDTTTAAPVDGQALVWNNSTSQWEPGGVSGEIEWTLTANGSTDYIFAGAGFAGTETDPAIYVMRGQTYKFTNAMGAHPFQIQSTQGLGGTAYSDGVTNNAVSNGTLTWEVRMDAPSTLYYQCTSHADMNGTIYVLDEGSAVASIDDLSDVDTSTVAPTDGQALVWDNANSKWEPGTISGGGGTTLPSGSADGEALIWEDGAWAVGPVIGGVDYTPSGATTNSTPPTGFSVWVDTWNTGVSGITYSNSDRTATHSSGDVSAYSVTGKSTGKWYTELSLVGVDTDMIVGFATSNTASIPGISGTGGFGIRQGGSSFDDAGVTVDAGYNNAWGYSNYVMFAIDFDAKLIWFGVNGTWQNSGDPAAGTGYVFSAWTGTPTWYLGFRLLSSGDSGTWEPYSAANVTIPYSIDKLDDVDTSTVAPTDGQALVWDNTTQKWEPGTVSGGGGGTSLPSGTTDGQALIWENGAWAVGPAIGGVDYLQGSTLTNNYTAPTGFSYWIDTFSLRDPANATLSNNNLTATCGGAITQAYSNSSKSSGLWYWEISIDGGTDTNAWIGIAPDLTNWVGSSESSGIGINGSGGIANNTGGTAISSVSSHTSGDIRMFALDADNKKLWIGKNGTWENSGDPAAGTGEVLYGWTGTPDWLFICRLENINSGWGNTIQITGSPGTQVTIPYSIDKLDDVDTSTVAPTDGQALLWDAANSKWEPGTVSGGGGSGTSLPSAQDGEALIYENGQWVAGPVIGGVDYTPSNADANYSNVELLLLANGTNGSTTFIDSSSSPRTVTPTGNAILSTTQSKFGGSSIYLDGSGDYLTVTADTDLVDWLTAGAFTVEAWVYTDSSWTSWGRSTTTPVMCGNMSPTGATNNWSFGPDSNGNVGFYYYSAGVQQVTGSTALSTGAWHHVAMSYDGATIKVFANGVLDASVAVSGSPTINANDGFVIGQYANTSALNGYIDDLRVTQGVARYTATFTPPTAELPLGASNITIPYSIDNLDDVDTSTVAPTDGQALVWDNTAQKWEPGATLPSGTSDGEALIWENGTWAVGPVIGGVDYTSGTVSTYTAPSGFNYWNDTFTFNGGANITLSNNDLTAEGSGSEVTPAYSTSTKSTGKWYWEISLTGVNTDTLLGIVVNTNSFPGASGTGGLGLYHNGTWFNDSGATTVNTSSLSESDVVMFALDADAKKLWVGLNGTWENSGDPAAGTGEVAYSWTATPDWLFAVRTYNSGMIYTIENYAGAQTTIPYSIDKLDDVDTSTAAPTDGQSLVWNATNSRWEPATVSGGGGITRAQATAITLLFS